MKYIKELDGVRGVAVFFVLFSHWLNLSPLNSSFFGFIGVTIFFVLSGFLITSILSNSFQNESNKKVITIFFLRRTIRIFPIYFLIIFVGLMFGYKPFQTNLIWLVTYNVNHLMCIKDITPFVHFWTLSVEEQFYIFFPFTLLLFRRFNLIYVSIAFILIAIISRTFLFYSNINKDTHNVLQCLTICCLDSFFFGVILSWIYKLKSNSFFVKLSSNSLVTVVSFVLLFGIHYICLNNNITLGKTPFGRSLYSLFAFCFIGYVLFGKHKIISIALGNKVVVYIGKISYGIYLYHLFIPLILSSLFGFEKMNHSTGINFLIFLVCTILLSSLSFFCFEQPLNKLKDTYFIKK